MIGNLSMEDLARVRRMSRTDAEAWLKTFDLSEQDYAKVLQLAGKDLKPVPVVDHRERSVPRGVLFDPGRPTWFVAAWLAGASWRQLAYMHKITPQTVMASADKVMQSIERQRQRINQQMTYEALAEYRVTYLSRDWTGMSPLQVAQTLLSTTELDR